MNFADFIGKVAKDSPLGISVLFGDFRIYLFLCVYESACIYDM